MSFDLNILGQGETWRDSRGNVHRIADMDADYRVNVVRMLERDARRIATRAMLNLVYGYMPDEDTMAYLSVSSAIERETDLMLSDPVKWLHTQPLLLALTEQPQEPEITDETSMPMDQWFFVAPVRTWDHGLAAWVEEGTYTSTTPLQGIRLLVAHGRTGDFYAVWHCEAAVRSSRLTVEAALHAAPDRLMAFIDGALFQLDDALCAKVHAFPEITTPS